MCWTIHFVRPTGFLYYKINIKSKKTASAFTKNVKALAVWEYVYFCRGAADLIIPRTHEASLQFFRQLNDSAEAFFRKSE